MSIQKNSKKGSRLTRQHWLNIMIISVSAMILLSVLVGRMINKPTETNAIANQAIELVQIDFGEQQLILNNGRWTSSDGLFQEEQVLQIVERWLSLLQQQGQPVTTQITTGKTVLIYLSSRKQPIVCKIYLAEDKMRIRFVTANLEFLLSADEFERYYPKAISE